MRRLYFHVGMQRTATTAIQRHLGRERPALAQRGYLYPLGVDRHNRELRQVITGAISGKDLADRLEAEADAAGDIHALILSDEDVSRQMDYRVFADLSRRFEVKVVTVLRRQDLWLESWYLQNIKWQWNPLWAHIPLDRFLDQRAEIPWLNFERMLSAQEAVFGREAILTWTFEPEEMPGGPVANFLNRIGLTGLPAAETRVNASFSPRVSEFMRHLPLDTLDPKERALLEEAFSALDRRLGPPKSELLIPHDRRQALLAEYADGNAWVAQRYFGRKRLFHTPPPDATAPLADMAFPDAASDILRSLVAPFIEELGEVLTVHRLLRDRQNRKG